MKKVMYLVFAMALVIGFTSCDKEEDAAILTQDTTSLLKVDEAGNSDIVMDLVAQAIPTVSRDLTQGEIDGLLLMREEEKLARDVYNYFATLYTTRIFGNIANSENTHMEAVKYLLDLYELEDPAAVEPGVFNNPELQQLYNDLTVQGAVSLEAALTVGGAIEEIDIIDLMELLEATTNTDLTLVYGNLLKGSRNHLRAFVRTLSRQGFVYEPQYLDEVLYNEIINSTYERGHYGSSVR